MNRDELIFVNFLRTNADNLLALRHVDGKGWGFGESVGEGSPDRPRPCRLRLLPLTRQPITLRVGCVYVRGKPQTLINLQKITLSQSLYVHEYLFLLL